MKDRLSLLFAKLAHDPVGAYTRIGQKLIDATPPDAQRITELAIEANEAHLRQMPPLLKARLLTTLADHVRATQEAGGTPSNDVRVAGYRLAVSTPMPESVVKRFDDTEKEMLKRLRFMIMGDAPEGKSFKTDPSTPIPPNKVRDFAGDFLDQFSEVYGIIPGIGFKPLAEQYRGKILGHAYWNAYEGAPEIAADIGDVKTLGDLVYLVATLAHEAVHAAAFRIHIKDKGLWETEGLSGQYNDKSGFKPASVRTSNQYIDYKELPEAYIFKALTDKAFYTSDNKYIYGNHPEEIQAERTGIRLGHEFSQFMGFKPDPALFAATLKNYPSQELVTQLTALFGDQPDAFKIAPKKGEVVPANKRRGFGLGKRKAHSKDPTNHEDPRRTSRAKNTVLPPV